MINWPQEVVMDIARRRCVLFLGSGVSRNSVNTAGRRPDTWYNFLNNALQGITPKAHIKKLLGENDYLTACELIKRNLGRDAFTNLLRNEYLTPAYIPAEIHKVIFKIDSRIVATPNFDKIYETYANSEAHGSIVVKHHYDEDVSSLVRETGRLIIKVHGTIDAPNNMIFTRAEYAQARSKYRNFYELIEALSMTHTFVFIGCGVNDPDVRLLLEDTFFKHKFSRAHILLMPSKSLHKDVIDVIEDTMNLKIIPYSSKDNHKELLDSLQALVAQVEVVRENLRTDSNW